jgi:hypothetical protein
MSPRERIGQIDKQIDAIRRQVVALEKPADTPAAWQRAWDRHPALREQETALFRQRGLIQLERDKLEAKQLRADSSFPRPKKCPTCHAHTLYA